MKGPGSQRPEKINSLLAGLFRQSGWQDKLDLHAVFSFWDEMVGKRISEQARPSVIRGTVLWVLVSDPVWMQQLHLQKILLLEKINQRLAGQKLTDIRFKLAHGGQKGPPAEKGGPPAEKEIDQGKKQAFSQLTSGIKNDEIKKALQSFWAKMEKKR